jgi:hypothetical protein
MGVVTYAIPIETPWMDGPGIPSFVKYRRANNDD